MIELGDRVTVITQPSRGPGTVVGLNGARVIVEFDMHPGRENIRPDDLEPDAGIPDAKAALAKALEFKRQRDECLKAIWEITDSVTEAGVARVRAEVKAASAERERNAAYREMAEMRELIAWAAAPGVYLAEIKRDFRVYLDR